MKQIFVAFSLIAFSICALAPGVELHAQGTPSEAGPPPPLPERQVPAKDPSRLLSLVSALPANASEGDLSRALDSLLPEVFTATNQDLPAIAETVAALRQQPGAVQALAKRYRELESGDFDQRLLTLGLVGELKRPDAAAFLGEVVWAPLPARQDAPEGLLNERELEEMVQAKAVQGLAFVASSETDQAVREVMLKHPARHVRVTAIDAYLWNHGDQPEVAKELYELLPAELHPFVERPRFHAGVDPKEFAALLAAWQQKWAGAEP